MNKNIFNNSQETRSCKCGGEHKVGYVTYKNESVHLTMWCEDKNAWRAISFKPYLNIPSVLSGPAKRYNKQIELLNKSPFVNMRADRHKTSKENLPKKIKAYMK